jgi:kumamolisin
VRRLPVLLLALLSLAAPAAAGATSSADRVLVADVPARLAQARLVGAPPPAQRMSIGLTLAHPDPAGEDALLAALFDRSSPAYHQFLTPAGYAERFGVSEATQHAVAAWLADAGLRVDSIAGAGDYVLASGSVAQVERLLNTTIGRYDIGGQRFDANAKPPVVPRRLPIFDVLGLDSTRRHKTMLDLDGLLGTKTQAAPNTGAQSADDLRSIYEHPAGVDGEGVSVAILGNGASDQAIADLHSFDRLNGLPQLPVDVVHTPAGGDYSDTSGSLEWNIDMQAVHGMAPAISRQVLYFSPTLADSELNASLATWVNDPNGPPIMNASLGECEQIPVLSWAIGAPALSQSVAASAQPTTTQLLQQAVMEGRTFFAASGDSGSTCDVTPGNFTAGVPSGLPLTSDPANTPFSTGVGGTVLYGDGNEPAARYQETAWTGSGGNPSPFITAPDYQQGVANLGRPCVVDSSGRTTNTGQLCRGVPDVAAMSGDAISNGYAIVSGGEEMAGGGTSLSSPLWAGMWADLASTAAPGSSGYGFANRSIYIIGKDPARYGQAFHDITTGTNGLNSALAGYDYVTGFGVPRLAGLIDQVQQVSPSVPRRASNLCKDRSAPTTSFTRRKLRTSRKRVVVAGTANDRGCRAGKAGTVKKVRVAVARLSGKRCRFAKAHGGFTPKRSCAKRVYLTAKGTTKWTRTIRGKLARGSYRAFVRATDATGNAPKTPRSLRFRVR